jgi:hypothetical protein
VVLLLALADRRLASVVLLLALVALLRVLVARAVVFLTLDSLARLGLAVMLLVFRVVAVSKDVLQLSGLGRQPMATLAPVTRGMATGMAEGGTGLTGFMPMAVPMPRATMAATTLPPTGEVPTGAFWSAAETDTLTCWLSVTGTAVSHWERIESWAAMKALPVVSKCRLWSDLPKRGSCSVISSDLLGWGKALALQLLFLRTSESMGNHDSNVVGAGRVG